MTALTRSPYYIKIPWYYPTSADIRTYYTIKLFVWSGDIDSVPATPEYEIRKDNVVNSVGVEKIDIGRLLNDFIDFTPSRNTGTQIYNANTNCKCYRAEIYYETLTKPQIIREGVFMQGYGYGYEGENAKPPADRVYLLNREYNVGQNTVFVIPVETYSIPAAGVDFSVQSYPNGYINFISNTGIDSEDNSNTFVKYISIDVSEAPNEKYIRLLYGGNIQSVPAVKIFLYITHEDIFTPYDVYFQNKQGHLQTMTFFKERKDTLSTKSENYNSNIGQPSTGIHQFVDYNKNAVKPFKMSTGFVDESINEDITQLLLSEKVYIYENDLMIPVNVTQNSLSYKNQVNDKLVDYVLDFKYSFDMINSI